MHTLCAESWIVQRTRRLCAGPLWTDWAAFYRGILCPQTILLCTALRQNVKLPDLRARFKSMSWHSRECEKFDAVRHHDDFSHSLFASSRPRSTGSNQRSCQPPAMGNPAFSVSSCADTLPALRFAGVQEMTTSRGRRQRLHLSRSPTPRRSGSVRAAHPDPSRRDHRTHAMSIAAEFSGRVHSRPSGQGEPHPTLYHTDLFTTSKMETDAHCTLLTARRSQSFQRFCGVRLAGKRPVSTETGRKQPSDANG